MATLIDQLKCMPPGYQAVLDEVIRALELIQRTGYGVVHIEISDHKKWNVKTTTSAASSASGLAAVLSHQ